MKGIKVIINVSPNFVIPGFEGKNHLEFEQENVIPCNAGRRLSRLINELLQNRDW